MDPTQIPSFKLSIVVNFATQISRIRMAPAKSGFACRVRIGRKRPRSYAKPYGLFQADLSAFVFELGALAFGGRRCQAILQEP